MHDLRISFDEKCHISKSHGGRGEGVCMVPSVELTYDMIASNVHVSFRGSRIPSISYTEPGYKGHGIEHYSEFERLEKKFEKLAKHIKRETLSIENLNWSLSTPHGASPLCDHPDDSSWVVGDREDQEGFNCYRIRASPRVLFAVFYKRMRLYGLPVSALRKLLWRSFNLEEFVWFRLTSHNKEPRATLPMYINSMYLGRIAVFTELRKGIDNQSFLETFFVRPDMDCVQLVSLGKSDMVWDVDLTIGQLLLRSLRTLEIMQLKRSINSTSRLNTTKYLTMDWKHLFPLIRFVKELIVGGYKPAFVLPQNQSLSGEFVDVLVRLELLCSDLSALVKLSSTISRDTWYELSLPERLFPELRHLYLKGVVAMSLSLESYPKLTLTKTCTTLDLSSAIRYPIFL